MRRGRPEFRGPRPREAPPAPSDALVSRARSLAGRGLTAALSLLSVVTAARECGCKGSKLPPSGKETPGRRKLPSRSCEKEGERKRSSFSLCALCGFFFLNRYFFFKRNISVLLSVIISREISQNHRNVTETRREAGAEAVPAAPGHPSHLGTGTRLRRRPGCGSAKLWGRRAGLRLQGGCVDRGQPPNHDVSRPGRSAGRLV